MKKYLVAALLILALALVVVSDASPSVRHFSKCVHRCGSLSAACVRRCKSSTLEAVKQGSMADEELSDDDMLNVVSSVWWWDDDDDSNIDDDDDDDDDDSVDDDDTNAPPANPIDQRLIWQNYRTELFKFLKRGGDDSGMQLLRNPITADWDEEPRNLYTLANQISAWGVEYTPREGVSVPQQYGLFLSMIDINTNSSSDASNPEIEAAQRAYDDAVARLEASRGRCQDMYERFKTHLDIPYEQFEAQRCMAVGNDVTNVQIKEFELELAKKQNAGPHADLAEARAKFAEADKSYAWSESFLNTLARFKRKILQNTSDSFAISVTKSSRTDTTVTKEWAELETMSDFITVEDEGEADEENTDEDEEEPRKEKKKKGGKRNKNKKSSFQFTTSADNFRMDIQAPGYTNIQIAPTEWFSHSVLSKYQTGPFSGEVNFFGKDGTFNQLARSLYVLYKPSVSLYVEHEDATTLEDLVTKKKTIKLGPFSVDTVKVSKKPVSTKGRKDVFKVDFAVSTEEPIVVAIDNHILV